jgi:hypothetical protein
MFAARAWIQPIREERRSRVRFPVCVELEYVLRPEAGVLIAGKGRTMDISSDGVMFESDHPLSAGKPIVLRIAWPARLNATVGLRFIAYGRTVRVHEHHVAVQFSRHEFRTYALKSGCH